MFNLGAILIGLGAAFVVGFSKTALPGAALIAVPMIAMVANGRLVPGATLPILIAGDIFAVVWYHHHSRWDLLRPLAVWVGVGFTLGVSFFLAVGDATRSLEVTIGLIVLVMVGLHLYRLLAESDQAPNPAVSLYGTAGGFTTFVSSAAGPVMNTYMASLRLSKEELIGTSAVFYLAVNVSKIPFYLALGEWSVGGRFFTWDSLAYDALVVPGGLVGVFLGRSVFERIAQRTFLILVLVLSGIGGMKLLV